MNANIKMLSAMAALGLVTVGCGARKDAGDDGALGVGESELVADDGEAAEADEDVEVGVEEPLSGATPLEPSAAPIDASETDLMGKVRTNPGLFFQPAGCITTTIAGNVATHVFDGCTGPYEMTTFNGTVTSTYVREAGKLTITHAATNFRINGATISGSRNVVYTREGTTLTKTRTGSWSGSTAKGRPITHEASFVTSYDFSTRCISRDGSATTTIGGRSLSRSITDYERCGIGRLGCPESGEIALSRTRNGETLSLTIEFLGGRSMRITRPDGTQVDRQLLCNAQ